MIVVAFIVGAALLLFGIKHAPSRHPHSIYHQRKGQRE